MKYLRSAMRRPKSRKPPSLHLHISEETSSRCSSVLSDCDADDEGFMSSGEFLPSRPLSLAIPAGPYYPRRPTLQEVLSNTAPPPWTLAAFMQYLSQNHCLETLEFTMDAKRYEKHYRDMVDGDSHTPISPQSTECEYVRMLWQKLLDAYIAPNGPREVNLPSNVRDRLLSQPFALAPPDPAELDTSVRIIYELMDESVLVPFINSVAPSRSAGTFSSPWTSDESMNDVHMTGSLDEQSLSPIKPRNQRDGSPPCGGDSLPQPYRGTSPRHFHHPHLTAALVGRSGVPRLSTYLPGSSGPLSTEAPDTLTDDGTDSPSPSVSALEPMTPPDTPPTSNVAFDVSPGTSPHPARDGSSSWKKMGAKLGWKKTRSAHGSGTFRFPLGRETSDDSEATAPSEHPAAAMVHGTTLQLSDASDSESPVLVAHPGSPVDLTGRCPSLAAALTIQCLYHGSEEEVFNTERSTESVGVRGERIREDGVAAKAYTDRVNGYGTLEQDTQLIPRRRALRRPSRYAPAKVPEQDQAAHGISCPGGSTNVTTTLSETTQMDFEFGEHSERGLCISAHPTAHESRSSLATTSTAASTFVDDKSSYSALNIDTSVASSAASMVSSATSIQSAVTMTSSDIYGWEEGLDRQIRRNRHNPCEREGARRLPSGGRTMGPRHRDGVHDHQDQLGAVKRRNLLCRVLNFSGSRGESRGPADDVAESGTMICPRNEYPTSAT
ncbi:hypothetical protein B2J93_3896 [Marssonina coronariae]|uniref:RGS domain-containing protein n=1 Tax=Diplocarpon coronariae TaxID=2795749 RepID=A0A218YZA9_9HELO|nr:hypothetical protein B2J93_3896 [Marssonina coronariae]